MRACIKVKKEEDLWIMKNKPVKRVHERKHEAGDEGECLPCT